MGEIRSAAFVVLVLLFAPSCLEPPRPVESPAAGTPAPLTKSDAEPAELTTPNTAPSAPPVVRDVEAPPVPLDAPLHQRNINPAKWTAARESYVSRVATRQQLPLGGESRVGFAHMLNALHLRIHPYFSDQYLASRTDPERALSVKLELSVLGTGELGVLGVTRSSGRPEFDAAALESVQRALPMDPVDPHLLSSDGHLYVTWEFHATRHYACSTYFAQPHRLAER